MTEKVISVGKAEFLEWLADWGEVGEDDEIIQVRIGYGRDIEVTIGKEED